MALLALPEHVECPLCGGRGTIRGRAWRRDLQAHHRCAFCAGAGSVSREDVRLLQELREQMQRVADAMQGGDGDAAAKAYRVAIRLARPLLRTH